VGLQFGLIKSTYALTSLHLQVLQMASWQKNSFISNQEWCRECEMFFIRVLTAGNLTAVSKIEPWFIITLCQFRIAVLTWIPRVNSLSNSCLRGCILHKPSALTRQRHLVFYSGGSGTNCSDETESRQWTWWRNAGVPRRHHRFVEI